MTEPIPTRPLLTPLRRVPTPKGDVLHGLRLSDPGYAGFGEAYFSLVLPGVIKGWKRHRRMTLNLVCPHGRIRVAVYEGSALVLDTVLSPETEEAYRRLTVPPGFHVGFQGVAAEPSILLNVASIEHDPSEADTLPLEALAWPS